MNRNMIILGLIAAVVVAVFAWNKVSGQKGRVIVSKVTQRNAVLLAGQKQLVAAGACADSGDKPKCFVQFIVAHGGVTYASDLGLYSGTALAICGMPDVSCRFELMDRLILLINPEKIKSTLESEVAKASHPNFKAAYDVQIDFLGKFLRMHRTNIARQIEDTTDQDMRSNFTRYLQATDTAIAKLPVAQ